MAKIDPKKVERNLMKRIRAMTEQEYANWLEQGIELMKTMPSGADIWFLEKQRKEWKIDAYMREIHGEIPPEWREHNKS